MAARPRSFRRWSKRRWPDTTRGLFTLAAACWRGFGVLGVAAACLHLSAASSPAAPLSVTGHVQYETFGYPDSDAAAPSWENFFSATLRASGRITSTLTWRLEGQAVADDVGFTAGGYSPRNDSRRRPYLSVILGALDYRPSARLRFTIGKQIVSWSIFDEIQPANLITPRDESDVFRRVEQGVPALSALYGSGGSFAELVVVPLAFTPSRLPQGRWNIIRGEVVERQELPPVQLDETQVAARIRTRLGALEAGLLGYIGRDTAAVFIPGPLILIGIVGGSPQFKAQIINRYPRLRAGGATASYPLGERLLLRAEVIYFDSSDAHRDDFVHSVVGAEYALDEWRVVLNYLRDDQTDAASEEVTSKGERRFFQDFIFGELRHDAGGRLRGRLRGGYDVTGEFLLVQPEVSWRLWRTLRIALVAELIDANRESYDHNKISYFDTIRHEDRLGARIEYDF